MKMIPIGGFLEKFPVASKEWVDCMKKAGALIPVFEIGESVNVSGRPGVVVGYYRDGIWDCRTEFSKTAISGFTLSSWLDLSWKAGYPVANNWFTIPKDGWIGEWRAGEQVDLTVGGLSPDER